MIAYYVDTKGNYLGGFEGVDPPAGAVQVPYAPDDARQVWDGKSYSAISQPAVYRIAKTTPWLRMTDEEAATMDAVMSETSARLKQIYMAAQYLSSDDALWSTLHQILVDQFGPDRADELLAPET